MGLHIRVDFPAFPPLVLHLHTLRIVLNVFPQMWDCIGRTIGFRVTVNYMSDKGAEKSGLSSQQMATNLHPCIRELTNAVYALELR